MRSTGIRLRLRPKEDNPVPADADLGPSKGSYNVRTGNTLPVVDHTNGRTEDSVNASCTVWLITAELRGFDAVSGQREKSIRG